jgi:hypothetical protein
MNTKTALSVFSSLLFAAIGCFGQGTPDCQWTDTFVAAVAGASHPNSSGGASPCVAYRVTYEAKLPMNALTLELEGAPWNNTGTGPGTFVAITGTAIVQGVNPMIDPANATLATTGTVYYPFVRLNMTVFTPTGATGSVTARIYGYKGTSARSGGGGGAPSGPAGGALANNYPNPTLSQPVQAADGTTGADMTVRAGDGTTGRGGLASFDAGTSNSGVQGLTRIVGSWNGTATVNRIACVDPSSSSAVTDCAIGANVGAIGVALTASTPVRVVSNGDALLETDNAAVVGGNICISQSVAGQGHNNGFGVCPPGTAVGIVRSITALTSLGQATATLPLVTIGIIAAGQAGSTGTRIVPGSTDTILEADNGGMVVYTAPTGTVAVAMDCPSATNFQRGWATQLKSVDANAVTITLTGACYFDNAVIPTAMLVTGGGIFIQSDGTNFYTQRTLGGTTTPGSIPYYSDFETVQPSGLLDQYQIVLGGGAGNPPYTLGSLGTTSQVLCGNASGDPSWCKVPLPTATDLILGGVTMSTPTSSVAVATDDARNSNARPPTASPYHTVTDGAPIAWDLGSATVTNGIVTLIHTTATRALNISNVVNGGFYTLVIKQDATGGALMTLGTGCIWKVVNAGVGAIVLTAAANGIDIFAFTADGTNCYAVLNSNFN